MSLYRQPGRPRLVPALAALGAGLLVGGLVGFAIGKSSAEDESLADQVAGLREDARPIGAALELASIEYGEAVRGGRIVAATEYQAVQADVERAEATFEEIAENAAALDAAAAQRLREGLERLRRDVEDRQDPARIDADTAFLEATLAELAGGP